MALLALGVSPGQGTRGSLNKGTGMPTLLEKRRETVEIFESILAGCLASGHHCFEESALAPPLNGMALAMPPGTCHVSQPIWNAHSSNTA
eukprot:1127037-Pelagomonas_calceolata.AAC.1